jgi:hypothetical protein
MLLGENLPPKATSPQMRKIYRMTAVKCSCVRRIITKTKTINYFTVVTGLDHNTVGTSRLNRPQSLGAIENCFDCLTLVR